MHIQGRTYIVTGGSSGLGEATTKLLLSKGAYVSVLDLNPLKSLSKDEEERVLFTATNVASTESLETAVKNTIQWTQKTHAPLSGVCTCAGIGGPALALPKQNPDADHNSVKYYDINNFDRVIGINLRGTVDLVRLAIPHMALNEPLGEDGERGVVILVSSTAAYEGQIGQLAYSASKGAIASLILPLARELGPKAGIRVMGVAPGLFQTSMTSAPPKPKAKGTGATTGLAKPIASKNAVPPAMVNYPMRMGQGHEFARLVQDIIENPMLNGTVIRLDGGGRMPARL